MTRHPYGPDELDRVDPELDLEAANETVEVRHDKDVRLTSLHELDSSSKAGPLRERRASRYVQFLDRVHELQPVSLAGGPDTLGLLRRRHELLAVTLSPTRNADDADGPTNGGSLGSRRGTPSSGLLAQIGFG